MAEEGMESDVKGHQQQQMTTVMEGGKISSNFNLSFNNSFNTSYTNNKTTAINQKPKLEFSATLDKHNTKKNFKGFISQDAVVLEKKLQSQLADAPDSEQGFVQISNTFDEIIR